ncbi:MAG: YlxM family DNA-binding protein [Anaerovoracaceae bacterium]
MFDKIAEVSLLYDFYGELLTSRQREVMQLYHEENLSLSEIASEFSISRQGVHDALKNAEKALYEYEDKLGLVEKFGKTRAAVSEIEKSLDILIEENRDNPGLTDKLTNIKNVIDKIDE